jgi:dephospho-CoA kinase
VSSFKNGIVVTGGIGTGKSTFLTLVKMYGYPVIDADLIAREVFGEMRKEIEKRFGTANRRELAKIVFSDRKKLEELEKLLHPKIKERILEEARKLEGRGVPYFIDIPLYYEKGHYPEFDRVVVVYAPREVQIERVMKRDGRTREEVEAILANQLDIEEKKRRATYLIDNSGSLKSLQRQVERLLHKLTEGGER